MYFTIFDTLYRRGPFTKSAATSLLASQIARISQTAVSLACQAHAYISLYSRRDTRRSEHSLSLSEKEREIESDCMRLVCISSLSLLFCPSRGTKRRYEGVERNKVKRSGTGSALFSILGLLCAK